jgi:hypothetical protein
MSQIGLVTDFENPVKLKVIVTKVCQRVKWLVGWQPNTRNGLKKSGESLVSSQKNPPN